MKFPIAVDKMWNTMWRRLNGKEIAIVGIDDVTEAEEIPEREKMMEGTEAESAKGSVSKRPLQIEKEAAKLIKKEKEKTKIWKTGGAVEREEAIRNVVPVRNAFRSRRFKRTPTTTMNPAISNNNNALDARRFRLHQRKRHDPTVEDVSA